MKTGQANPRRSKRTAAVIAALLVLVLILIAVLVFLLTNARSNAGKEIELGRKYLEDMDYEQAVLAFTSAITIDEKAVDAYIGRAQAYGALEQRDDALADYAQALELAPERADEIRHIRHETVGSTAEQPQTAADVTWNAAPANSYLDVEPILAEPFVNDTARASGNDKVIDALSAISTESSYPSYSYWDRYYAVYMPDGIHLFNMETQALSDFYSESAHPLEVSSLSEISCEGITGLPDSFYQDRSLASWEVVGGPGWDNDFIGKLIWDVPTGKAFFEEYRYGYSRYAQITPARLHKNYPIRQGSLSTVIDVSAGTGAFDWSGTNASPWRAEGLPYAYDGANADRYALLGTDGTLLTDFVYEAMEASSCGLTAACRDGRWGYLDEKGQELTEFVYDAPWPATSLGEMAYPATCDTIVVAKDGRYGVLYRDGSLLIDFGQFEELAPAWNDLLWAKADGQWGIIDLKAVKRNAGIWVEDPETDAAAADGAPAGDTAAPGSGYTVEDTILYTNNEDSEIHMLQIKGLENPATEKINQVLRETAEDAQNYVVENIDENGVAQAYLYATYRILEASSTRLCVLHDTYSGFLGGMHGWSGLESFVFDLTTGERLALADYADPEQLAHTLYQGENGYDYLLMEEDGTPLSDGTTIQEVFDSSFVYGEGEAAIYLSGYDGRWEGGGSNGASYWENGMLYITVPSLYHAQGDYLLVRFNYGQ